MMDCRPTQSRKVSGDYEVKVDGAWISVSEDKINNVIAPDGGAHVCASRQVGRNKGVLRTARCPMFFVERTASILMSQTIEVDPNEAVRGYDLSSAVLHASLENSGGTGMA